MEEEEEEVMSVMSREGLCEQHNQPHVREQVGLHEDHFLWWKSG
jgi:hypothetical protein